jgi:predicted nucleic acid-binding protein
VSRHPLRGTSKLKAIAALHVATAIKHQSAFFITADQDIAKRAQGIEVVNLNDYLPVAQFYCF